MYNMMSCAGFTNSGCSMAWAGMVLAVFIIMIARKYLFELALNQDLGPMEFAISIAATIFVYFIIVGLSGAYKWGILGGIVAGLAAGYFASTMMGGGGDGGGSNQF